MNRFLLSFLLLGTLSATAQDFKPFKVNLSLGYARPSGSGASGGVMFSIEPKYGLSDQIDIGIRAELALMARAYTINGQDANGEIKGAGSYLLTGTYLLSQPNFRPYVGAGVGIFSTASGTFNTVGGSTSTSDAVAGGTKLGGMVRTGFKAGHFNLGLEYNIVPTTKGVILSQGAPGNYESPNSYFTLKLGVDIGGGRL